MNETKTILIKDTDGALSKETFKNDPEKEAVSAWFSDPDSDKRTLFLSPNNITYTAISDIMPSTYISFLAYNGTFGYTNKLYSTVLESQAGIVDMNTAPVMEYNPNGTEIPASTVASDEYLIDISMYDGTVDVIHYQEGILSKGEKTYLAKSIRSFPTTVSGLPQVSGNLVYLDGWYTYTHIIFRDVAANSNVLKDIFYGISGFIFKATDDGKIAINSESGDILIIPVGKTLIEDGIPQEESHDYEDILFSLNAVGSDYSTQSTAIFTHSQILVTEEIRDAITSEVVNAAMEDCCGPMEYSDWQKLIMKREAASIMFLNGLFRNAQIILESSRKMCSSALCSSSAGSGSIKFNC